MVEMRYQNQTCLSKEREARESIGVCKPSGSGRGNETDVFHTFFGLTALSLMGQYELDLIDHTYAIPVETMQTVFPHISSA